MASAGDPAGSVNGKGYWEVGAIREGRRLAHILIWELCVGDIPEGMEIDHIDGDPSNNLIWNLRLVTHKTNSQNRKRYSNNTTGVNGVNSFEKRGHSYYMATWMENGRMRTKTFSVLKYENALELAIAYRKMQIERLNASGEQYTDRHIGE